MEKSEVKSLTQEQKEIIDELKKIRIFDFKDISRHFKEEQMNKIETLQREIEEKMEKLKRLEQQHSDEKKVQKTFKGSFIGRRDKEGCKLHCGDIITLTVGDEEINGSIAYSTREARFCVIDEAGEEIWNRNIFGEIYYPLEDSEEVILRRSK